MHQAVRTDPVDQVTETRSAGNVVARREGVVKANGIELWFETFGDPTAPAVLPIMGAGMQALYWPEELCERLADAGRFVIRFDNRDVGQSTWFDKPATTARELFRSPVYTLQDMASDAVGLLDALSIARAHVVGASLGAAIAEWIALENPARVMSLTLMGYAEPASQHEVEQAWSQIPDEPEPEIVREELLDRLTTGARMAAGPGYAFDEQATRDMWDRMLQRGWSSAGDLRQRAAFYFSERASLQAVVDTNIPILMVEGTADPGFEWIKKVSADLPDVRLEAIEGMGHELPPAASEMIATHIIEHTN